MSDYVPTIGLEIHAELKTRTKMFCASRNDPDETRPNVNTCPVCLAHPGTLPIINGEAIRHVLRVGLSLGSRLADYTEFDRKNYFYPDLPKGYQLSQFEYPLVSGGTLADVPITRVHLEEDTASSIHDDATGETSIDYNRAGVPLMELVTEPEIHSAEEAGKFARELQLLLRYLDVSEANMEKGEMRVEANISVAREGERGTKVEIKNLNSFNIMERAVRYEIERQIQVLEGGGKVTQETRGWDEKKQATFAQRTKEGSADYRYFPDPDLPSLKLSEIPAFARGSLQSTMPELPAARRARYVTVGVKHDDADLFVRDTRLGDFFDAVTKGGSKETALIAANYIANDLVKIIRDVEGRDTVIQHEIPISVGHFKELLEMLSEKKINSRVAKDLLARSAASKNSPAALARAEGLLFEAGPQNEDFLSSVIIRVLKDHPVVVADYKAGKSAALEYLLGQCMRHVRGAANPETLRKMLKESLS